MNKQHENLSYRQAVLSIFFHFFIYFISCFYFLLALPSIISIPIPSIQNHKIRMLRKPPSWASRTFGLLANVECEKTAFNLADEGTREHSK